MMEILLSILIFLNLSNSKEEKAELVLRGGPIITMNPQQPRAEAVAVKGGKIIYVGDNSELQPWMGKSTKVIELEGRCLIPAFIEGHGHLLGLGYSRLELDLSGTKDERQVAEIVKKKAFQSKPGDWILGRGWDQNDWPQKAFPNQSSLSIAAAENPVVLTRVDGHAIWVNRKAMEIAGVQKKTADPEGGRILRDEAGEPTGVFVDNAMGLIRKKIPAHSAEEDRKAFDRAVQVCHQYGITSFQDMGSEAKTVALYKELAQSRKLDLRIDVFLSGSDSTLVDSYLSKKPELGLGGDRLSFRGVKLYADGALGSRGAALLGDYADEPGNRGLVMMSEEEILKVAKRALASGFQVATHAIGDLGNRLVLDAYEQAFQAVPSNRDPRFRIEHAQILSFQDISRFAKLGVIPSMQTTHCTSDMPWVEARIGKERAAAGAYVWRKLLDSGCRIVNGSDCPVESANPLLGIYAAVTRQDSKSQPLGGWYPDQKMTREEALRSHTLDAAYGVFEEGSKGSIEVGKLADFAVLSGDVLEVASPDLLKTFVWMTVLDGKVVYEKASGKKEN